MGGTGLHVHYPHISGMGGRHAVMMHLHISSHGHHPVHLLHLFEVIQLGKGAQRLPFPMAQPQGGRPGSIPVSYTHLDVYKRQLQPLPVSDELISRLAGKCEEIFPLESRFRRDEISDDEIHEMESLLKRFRPSPAKVLFREQCCALMLSLIHILRRNGIRRRGAP